MTLATKNNQPGNLELSSSRQNTPQQDSSQNDDLQSRDSGHESADADSPRPEESALDPERGRKSEKRTHLWRRRLFEGEAGLTRFVVEARAGAHMEDLLVVKQAIFDGLPAEENDEAGWKAAFFRAQALMEEFVVKKFGHPELAQWAASNGAVYATVDAGPKHCAAIPLERLNDQAALYDSETTWRERDAENAVLDIKHCAIWDYREKARDRGVTITLAAPCEYCVPAITAMITNKGLNASHQLTADEEVRGCIWTASRSPIENPAATPADPNGGPYS